MHHAGHRHRRKVRDGGDLDQRSAASLAGLAPVARDSGQHRGKRFIRGGRASLRQALYMPALVAVRFNADLKAKYEALRIAGSHPTTDAGYERVGR